MTNRIIYFKQKFSIIIVITIPNRYLLILMFYKNNVPSMLFPESKKGGRERALKV